MQSKHARRSAWGSIVLTAAVTSAAALSGCELLVDFDRSKIPQDGGTSDAETGGPTFTFDATTDGSSSDATMTTMQTGETGAPEAGSDAGTSDAGTAEAGTASAPAEGGEDSGPTAPGDAASDASTADESAAPPADDGAADDGADGSSASDDAADGAGE